MTVVVCWSVISLYRHETCASLEDKLQALWGQVPVDSPNRGHQPPVERLFVAPSSMSRAADSLAKRLFDIYMPSTV